MGERENTSGNPGIPERDNLRDREKKTARESIDGGGLGL
jgi:hypothetical protein